MVETKDSAADSPSPGQEKTGEAIDGRCSALQDAVRDVRTLLVYFSQVSDRSLQPLFADPLPTRSTQPRPVPPCKDYAEFLKRIIHIESIAAARADAGSPIPADDVSFLYQARDFLALAASPATAETIRITRAYVARRMQRSRLWNWLFSTSEAAARVPAVAADREVATFAGKLVGAVLLIEWLTLFGAIFVIALSTYALSGRLILAQQIATTENARKTDEALMKGGQLLQEAVLHALYDRHDRRLGDDLMPCDLGKRVQDARPSNSSGARFTLNGSGGVTDVPSIGDPEGQPNLLEKARLCEQAQHDRTQRFTALLHLRSWASVVTEHLWFVPRVFGVESTTLTEFVKRLTPEGCQFIAPYIGRLINYDDTSEHPSCAKTVMTFVTGSELVARSVLDSLTLYVLPVFYAVLGALAASHRWVRRRVDSCTLSYTDRGLVLQNSLLGVLTGSVIGLIASYLGKPEDGTSLGLSALALLAGYNTGAVFAFLDGVSARIFGAAKPA